MASLRILFCIGYSDCKLMLAISQLRLYKWSFLLVISDTFTRYMQLCLDVAPESHMVMPIPEHLKQISSQSNMGELHTNVVEESYLWNHDHLKLKVADAHQMGFWVQKFKMLWNSMKLSVKKNNELYFWGLNLWLGGGVLDVIWVLKSANQHTYDNR